MIIKTVFLPRCNTKNTNKHNKPTTIDKNEFTTNRLLYIVKPKTELWPLNMYSKII